LAFIQEIRSMDFVVYGMHVNSIFVLYHTWPGAYILVILVPFIIEITNKWLLQYDLGGRHSCSWKSQTSSEATL
jgi:hypothetical protein